MSPQTLASSGLPVTARLFTLVVSTCSPPTPSGSHHPCFRDTALSLHPLDESQPPRDLLFRRLRALPDMLPLLGSGKLLSSGLRPLSLVTASIFLAGSSHTSPSEAGAPQGLSVVLDLTSPWVTSLARGFLGHAVLIQCLGLDPKSIASWYLTGTRNAKEWKRAFTIQPSSLLWISPWWRGATITQ